MHLVQSVQSDVMTPRRNALSDGSIKAYKEPFEIHAIDYKEISQLADLFSLGQYLTFNSADSRQTFRCPIRSLYFVPKNQVGIIPLPPLIQIRHTEHHSICSAICMTISPISFAGIFQKMQRSPSG